MKNVKIKKNSIENLKKQVNKKFLSSISLQLSNKLNNSLIYSSKSSYFVNEGGFYKEAFTMHSLINYLSINNDIDEKINFYKLFNRLGMIKLVSFFTKYLFKESSVLLSIFNDLKSTKSQSNTNLILNSLKNLCNNNEKVFESLLLNEYLSKIIMYKTWGNNEAITTIIELLLKFKRFFIIEENKYKYDKEIIILKELSSHECIECKIKDCLTDIFNKKDIIN